MMPSTRNILLEKTNPFKLITIFPYLILIILICSPVLSNVSFAQKQRLEFQHIGFDKGLGSLFVQSIFQDDVGYMWFLTDFGLYKYDGYNFTLYKLPVNSQVISGNMPGTIAQDKQGNFWICSINGGVEKFNPELGKFTNYLLDKGQPPTSYANTALEVFIDGKENLWIGSSEGLYKFNKYDSTFAAFKHDENNPYSLGHNAVNGIFEDKTGNLWIATGGGLDRLDRTTNNFYHYWHYPNNQWGDYKTGMHWLQQIIEDDQGILWIGTDAGLLKYDRENNLFELYKPHSNEFFAGRHTILSLCDDGLGNIWLGTVGGMGVFNKSKKTFYYYAHNELNPNTLSYNFIVSLLLDKQGSLWIGTNYRGINKINLPNTSFKNYKHNPYENSGFSLKEVIWISKDKEGEICINTREGLGKLDKLKDKVLTKYKVRNDGMGYDRRNFDLWYYPTSGGLYLYNKSKSTWTSLIDSASYNLSTLFSATALGKNEKVWLGNQRGEFFSLDLKTKKFKLVKTIKGSIYAVFEDAYGFVWYGGYSTGIFKYNPKTNTTDEYYSDPDDSSTIFDDGFFSFCEDKNKNLWFGCLNGIVQYNRAENNFTRYYGNGDFLKEYVRAIEEDDNGNLWISTLKGITKFNPVTGQFKDYYSVRYFPGITLWRQVSFKASSGELYFGGENGFIRFHPDTIEEDTFAPPVVISSLKVFDKPFQLSDKVELAHSDNFLTVEFAALSYISSSENQYAYMMEGWDKDWIYCGTERKASYPNLLPGEYTFKVKGSNCNRVWNEAGTSLKIIIIPPWWKTWWAYLFYTLVILSIFITSTRFYINRQRLKHKLELESEHAEKLEEIARMKSDFFANISHEFRTPLTLILGPAEKIEKNQSANVIKDAGIITRNSRRLLQLVNQLLDLSKLDAGKLKLEASPRNIVSFVKGIALSFESLSEARDVMIKIKSDKEYIEIYFDREKMIKVFSNLLSNAFKFTPERENVIVSITETLNNTVEIRISNTGIGIPQKELPKLFDRFYQVDSSQIKEYEGTGIGLSLVKELIELHRGSITVNSKENNPEEKEKGWTEFTISLPLGKVHLKDEEISIADKETHKEVTLADEVEYLSPRILAESEAIPDESKTTILVVEDNYDMREYIKESLLEKYTIEEAVNGEQGARVAQTIIPDLIISDLMMPKMDGNELARILKNDERTSHIPIIILTAKSGQENKIEGLLTGADDYLTKPFDLKELRVRVENLINIRKKLQEKFNKADFLMKRSDKKLKSIDEKFLSKVLEVIEKHISEEEFTIEECSSEVGLSRTHFHKKLRALVGKSPSQYVRTVRLHRAKQLLESAVGNISEIAYTVGFSSLSYFSKCFKEEFGYTPKDYQR
jgi:signal transduction histidine kinase/ligand-binding sensor domain-containing protein/DNA-binding response OmpR family regulator